MTGAHDDSCRCDGCWAAWGRFYQPLYPHRGAADMAELLRNVRVYIASPDDGGPDEE